MPRRRGCVRRRPQGYAGRLLLRHREHGLDHVAVVRSLKGLVHLVERELLDEPVEGEPALGVQRDQRIDQRRGAALAAEDADDPLAPQGGQVVEENDAPAGAPPISATVPRMPTESAACRSTLTLPAQSMAKSAGPPQISWTAATGSATAPTSMVSVAP